MAKIKIRLYRKCILIKYLCHPPYIDQFNPLPNDKILDVTKLKAFADDKLNFARMMISHVDRVENTVGKGENAGYQHFLTVFSKAFFLRVVKSRDWVLRVNKTSLCLFEVF